MSASSKSRGRKDVKDVKNVKRSSRSLQRTPSESEDDVFDVTGVLFQAIPVASHQDPETSIKSRLRYEADQVTIGQSGDNLVYANAGGHGILHDMEEWKRKTNILMAKADNAACQIEELQKHISSLESRVRSLVKTSEGYLSIRKPFIDVYKRDVKDMEEIKGSKGIREGNSAAHHGDALADALLFDRDHRTDRSIYRELYGLEHQQVLEFHAATEDEGLFLVLNAHATMVAEGKPLSDDLKAAFSSFLEKVEKYWLQPPSKEPNSPLGSAYFTFWRKFNAQAQA